MKHVGIYHDSHLGAGKHKFAPVSKSSTYNIEAIKQISSEIIIRKRISLTLLVAFVPFITAVYLIGTYLDVNKSYFIALASVYGLYYLAYSMWACSSRCPTCGDTMSKRFMFIMPLLTCSHCGHDLRNPSKSQFRR